MRRLLPLLALFALTGSCGRNYRSRFRVERLPEAWNTAGITAVGGVVYACNARGGILAIDPETLSSTKPRGSERHPSAHRIDVDADGLWADERLDQELAEAPVLDDEHRLTLTCSLCSAAWTKDYAAVWCTRHGMRFLPKRTPSPHPPPLEVSEERRVLGVDHGRNRVWGVHAGSLIIADPSRAAWHRGTIEYRLRDMPSEELRLEEISILVFGRTQFAFLRRDTVYIGTPENERLAVKAAMAQPEPLTKIEFNALDQDLLLGRAAETIWAWDLESGDTVRFAGRWPFVYVHMRGKRILGFDGPRVFSASPDGADLRERDLSP